MECIQLKTSLFLHKRAKSIFLALLLALTARNPLYAQTPSPSQTAPAGLITALEGKVLLERAGNRTSAAQVNQAVQIGDRVTTGSSSRVTVTLSDGTQLGLAESASLVVTAINVDTSGQRIHTEINLMSGLLRSLVRHAPGNSPNYEVHTPNAVAAARGTNYDTDYAEGEKREGHDGCLKFTDVRVYDGVVEVWNQSDRRNAVKVSQGLRTVVPCTIPPEPPASTEPLLAEGVIGSAVAGSGVISGLGASGVLGGNGASRDPILGSRRLPVTASQ